jgi:hypothetical protein
MWVCANVLTQYLGERPHNADRLPEERRMPVLLHQREDVVDVGLDARSCDGDEQLQVLEQFFLFVDTSTINN